MIKIAGLSYDKGLISTTDEFNQFVHMLQSFKDASAEPFMLLIQASASGADLYAIYLEYKKSSLEGVNRIGKNTVDVLLLQNKEVLSDYNSIEYLFEKLQQVNYNPQSVSLVLAIIERSALEKDNSITNLEALFDILGKIPYQFLHNHLESSATVSEFQS